MKPKLTLRLCTPDHVETVEGTDMVVMRAITGDMGIMPGHEPHGAVLAHTSKVRTVLNGETQTCHQVFGGIAQVKDNVVTVMASHMETMGPAGEGP